MSNEPNWDYILKKSHREDRTTVKQKNNLETHARQIRQYLNNNSVAILEESQDYDDTPLPGIKVPFAFRETEFVRSKPKRFSMRKLPRKNSSVKEKKKGSDSEKNKRRKNCSVDGDKQAIEAAAQADCGLESNASNGETKPVESREEEPTMTSLSATELMLVSAEKGDLGTIQVLFDKPSEHSKSLCLTKDDKGEIPLHKTAKGGYLKCMKFLASYLPDKVSCVDNLGLTPAAHAAKNGHVNCLKWLVEESSAYVELAVRDGQMGLLHHAAVEGMEQCLSYLLGFMAKRKITTDVIDAQGQTPLHLAAKMGHLACVQTLVEHGADVLAKDHEGLTSAIVAYLQKQSICSRYLLMAESCWILASRVATLFREVNGFKKENKELKKTVENLKATKNSDLPNRPETVGAHTNDNGNHVADFSREECDKVPIGPRDRNFPDGESPKSTFTEADKQRPQLISQKNHVINPDGEINDAKHFKVVRQTSIQSDYNPTIPAVSTNSIAELPPAEKIKAKEIAMVTHQLMSTRHMQMIQEQKNKQIATEDTKPKVSPEETVVDVTRRPNINKTKNLRPMSLCDNLLFMRSETDINFAYKGKKNFLQRRSSCTDVNAQDAQAQFCHTDAKENGGKEKNFWDKFGARKLLSRKKSTKTRPNSVALNDLQTVSTDRILELYANESRVSTTGSTSRINSLIWEENELSSPMGRRTMSTNELKSQNVHSSFREPRSNFQPLSHFRMSERLPNTPKTKEFCGGEKPVECRRTRPVAKPRLKLKPGSDSDDSGCGTKTKESFQKNNERRLNTNIAEHSEEHVMNFENFGNTYGDASEGFRMKMTDENLECTDV